MKWWYIFIDRNMLPIYAVILVVSAAAIEHAVKKRKKKGLKNGV